MAKKFPDYNKDGKTTMADILIGRGVLPEKKMSEGGSTIADDPRYQQLMDMLSDAKSNKDNDAIREIQNDLRNEFGVKMMGGGSVDNAMKYEGGGNIMIKTIEISMNVPEKQKKGTGAAMSGTKFSGTF
jgi:hypothetical protein